MPSAEATITTDQPGRYLVQLCRHANGIGHQLRQLHGPGPHGGDTGPRPEVRHVEYTDTDGVLDLSWGRCTLHADTGALGVRVDAADDQNLTLIQRRIASDLERFGHREHLTVTWRRLQAPTGTD